MAKSSSKTDFKNLSSTASSTSKRIESPLAKYNSLGQLTCIVCNQIIKSEVIWNAHLNSKQHLANKQKLKEKLITGQQSSQQQKKETTEKNDTAVFKRPLSVTDQKASPESSINNKKQKLDNLIKQTDSIDLNKTKNAEKELVKQTQQQQKTAESEPSASSVTAVATSLPEGFFDDPDMDDKVRGVSREANLEAEYEEFKKIIQAEEQKAEIMVEQDDALRDIVRDLEQVDDLIERWSKIESLHQKREALLAANKIKKTQNDVNQNETMDHDHKDDENTKVNIPKDESDDENNTEDLDNVLGLSLRDKHRC